MVNYELKRATAYGQCTKYACDSSEHCIDYNAPVNFLIHNNILFIYIPIQWQ